MKLCLMSNLLEHPGACAFIEAARVAHPGVGFVVAGDLLNVFPEPGEDLRGSMFYELYGELLVEEMERLVRTRFAAPAQSRFVEPLRDMFLPAGRDHRKALLMADRRYQPYFASLARALAGAPLYFIPGNMDYPQLAFHHARQHQGIESLDGGVIDLGDVRVAGVGGIPRSAHPFRGVVEISPYEMADQEYERRLEGVRGAQVLITHLAPEEHPALDAFLATSPVELLICRAPFDFRRDQDFRGKLALERRHGKQVMKIRPFEHPENSAFVIDVTRALTSHVVEVFRFAG